MGSDTIYTAWTPGVGGAICLQLLTSGLSSDDKEISFFLACVSYRCCIFHHFIPNLILTIQAAHLLRTMCFILEQLQDCDKAERKVQRPLKHCPPNAHRVPCCLHHAHHSAQPASWSFSVGVAAAAGTQPRGFDKSEIYFCFA